MKKTINMIWKKGILSVALVAVGIFLGACNNTDVGKENMEVEITAVNDSEQNDNELMKEANVPAEPGYTVSGKIIGLLEGDKVNEIKFENMESGEKHVAAVTEEGYSIRLVNGTYEAKGYMVGYNMVCHVVVDGADVKKDIMYASTKPSKAIEYVSDIYVGCPDKENNYETMRAAVKAIEAMRRSNAMDRITVHIAPGIYREQVILNSPNVSFVNTNPAEEVKLTWYYGVGYQYYSAGPDKYYNEIFAADKYQKNTADRWGAATYIKSGATGFYAENITFENSFTKYICEEELADGVESTGETNTYDRTAEGADATIRAANERSAALAVEGDMAEFYQCKVLGGQDTMYTGAVRAYFNQCFLEGNTDYIFGKGDIVFENCELQFYGYSDKQSGAVLTAAADGQNYGYIFRNCFISANPDWKVASAKLGRPWRASAMVSYINCKLQRAGIIEPVGWGDMSGNKATEANFKEYNTTAVTGEIVKLDRRVTGVVEENPFPAAADIVDKAFAGWIPTTFVADNADIKLEKALTLSGEAKVGSVLKADFALQGDNEATNSSVIQWYKVTGDGESLVKASVAYVDRTYTVAQEDAGAQIKVVVSPETVSGYKAENVKITSDVVIMSEK